MQVGSNRAKQLILALSGAVPSYINKMRAVPNSLLQKGWLLNFHGIHISRISLVQAPFAKFHKRQFTGTIHEITKSVKAHS